MPQKALLLSLLLFSFWLFALSEGSAKDDGSQLWLKYLKIDGKQQLKQYRELISSATIKGGSATVKVIREELAKGLSGMLGKQVPIVSSSTNHVSILVGTLRSSEVIRDLHLRRDLNRLGRDGFLIRSLKVRGHRTIVIASNEDLGLLYGIFHFLRLLQTRQSIETLDIVSKPKIQYRILDHWDNLDGSIERGYAGKSLWKWDELPGKIRDRYFEYARANASIGINGTVLNNVNANPVMLKTGYLKKVAALANVFRPYGLRVFLSVNFSSPVGELSTSDPLNLKVRAWWKSKANEIYRLIPDFGGFLVKANSEGMPGPQDYGRTHADGANMLADALQPHNGIVMWRAFVYNAEVDADRVKRAYKEFVPLDGKFRQNVFVQAKNGPLDFQPREPVQPLFGSMRKTSLMLELQITQEYLGQSTHLVYLAPMWKEYLGFDTFAKGSGSTLASVVDGTLERYPMTGIAGVANTGNDRNWCGHFFAQANWFAFGRLAWDHTLAAGSIADEWIRMTLGNTPGVVAVVRSMMMGSWEACINYMTPLGLHHIMQADVHYGPGPANDEGRKDWTSVYYHRADSLGLGFDRSSTGSSATAQYAPLLQREFDRVYTCPEKYLLWFHHVGWTDTLKSGRSLWEELCSRYYAGTDYVETMLKEWNTLQGSLDPEIFSHVQKKLVQQRTDAAIWRDTCLQYFQKFSRLPVQRYPSDPAQK